MRTADYRPEEISLLSRHRRLFWFTARNRLIGAKIAGYAGGAKQAKKILELGAGSGNIARYLRQSGWRVDASDCYRESLPFLQQAAERSFLFDLISDPVPGELRRQYDLVIMGDVIEHLSEPVPALNKAAGFLRPGGFIIVTVPALKRLWSRYDEESGHKKRYTPEELKRELTAGGYQVKEIAYFLFVPALIIFVLRRFASGDEASVPGWANALLGLVCRLEAVIGRAVRFPFGSSLIAVAEAA
ncbi:MAG: class I SAM-dependent methyltransferase [Candidatus Margulisiibacteriota bacterium]